jgi:hypothetical protein
MALLAGGGAQPAAAAFARPRALCLGQHCVFVADTDNDCVRRVEFDSGHISVVVGAQGGQLALARPSGVAVHGNELYVADTLNHRVVLHNLATKSQRVVVGTGYSGYDGPMTVAAAARLSGPQGMAVHHATGDLYVADTGNHRVVRFSQRAAHIAVVLGISGVAGESHSRLRSEAGDTVQLCLPSDVAVCGPASDPQVFVVDAGNAKIWRVNRLGFAHVVLPASPHLTPCCVAVADFPDAGDDQLCGPSSVVQRQALASPQRAGGGPVALIVSDSVNHVLCRVTVSGAHGSATAFDDDHLSAIGRRNTSELLQRDLTDASLHGSPAAQRRLGRGAASDAAGDAPDGELRRQQPRLVEETVLDDDQYAVPVNPLPQRRDASHQHRGPQRRGPQHYGSLRQPSFGGGSLISAESAAMDDML